MERKSFVFYKSWSDVMGELPNAVRLEVYDAVTRYAFGEPVQGLAPLAQVAFAFIKRDLDAANDRYNSVVERNRENGKKGGRPPRSPSKGFSKNPNNPSGFLKTQQKPNDNDNDNDNDNEIPPIIPPPGGGIDGVSFEEVWKLYGCKGNKKTSAKKWANLKNHCREAAKNHIPRYVASTPDPQYRKNFESYINQEAWNDEIIEKPKTGSKVSHPAADYDNNKTFEKWQ